MRLGWLAKARYPPPFALTPTVIFSFDFTAQYLASLCPNDAIAPGGLVDVYVILLERGLLAAGEMKELSRACTERLHRLVALSPTLFTRRYGTRMAWLQQAVDCNDFETQKVRAFLFLSRPPLRARCCNERLVLV